MFLPYSFPHLNPPGKADNPAMSLLESFRTPRWVERQSRNFMSYLLMALDCLWDSFPDEAATEDVNVGLFNEN